MALARDGDSLQVEHLSGKLRAASGAESEPSTPATADAFSVEGETIAFRQARAKFEARYIDKVLNENNRNVSHTARVLGLSRVMLQKKMKEYELR